MNICIFGAGPGAMAMACRAMAAGHRVGLNELARFQSNFEGLDPSLSIGSKGLLDGRFNLAFAATEAEKGLQLGGCDHRGYPRRRRQPVTISI